MERHGRREGRTEREISGAVAQRLRLNSPPRNRASVGPEGCTERENWSRGEGHPNVSRTARRNTPPG